MKNLKYTVAAIGLTFCVTFTANAQQERLDDLFVALKSASGDTYEPIVKKIWTEWSKSGSASMDLLLQRGRDMMEEGEVKRAIEHFSALIDHAPEFAEGYNARATALFQAKRYGESLADIRMALALEPRHFGALSGLATILRDLGYDAQALEAWRAVREIHPNHPEIDRTIDSLSDQVDGRQI